MGCFCFAGAAFTQLSWGKIVQVWERVDFYGIYLLFLPVALTLFAMVFGPSIRQSDKRHVQ